MDSFQVGLCKARPHGVFEFQFSPLSVFYESSQLVVVSARVPKAEISHYFVCVA